MKRISAMRWRGECNIVVAEGATKWDIIHPERDKWNFGPTDKLLEYAQSHGMKMRGHTLIWYEALPAWAKKALEDDKSKAEALMEEHIGAVMSRYKGKFLSWDVVNEALKPGEAWWLGDQMRDTPWREAMGDSYVEKAFRMAAQADPDAQLVYNDYQIEAGSVKAKAALKLLRGLKDKNVPIHAVGLQAHMHTGSKLDPLENFCKEAKSLGLEVIITELDVFDSARATQEENDKRVAAKTKEFLDIISSVAVPKQILTWGLSDRHSWLSNAKWNKSNPTGRRIRGLPLDDNMRRKPMWRALHEFLEKA
ncbi:MAG: endo-1,4-beta-xylanase [Alphaproteobacteria bacterium]